MSSQRAEENLSQALRALARETVDSQASERVRIALVRELRARRRASALRLWLPVAAAVLIVVALWSVMDRRGAAPRIPEVAAIQPQPAPMPAVLPEEPAPEPAVPAVSSAVLRAKPASTRLPAPVTPWYLNTALPASAEGHVVNVTVDQAVASQFGVYIPGPSVRAQIFVGNDGLARAIRFVQ
jgi:hypothetical protein